VNGSVSEVPTTQPGPLRETLTFVFYRFEVAALVIWFVARWLVYGANLPVPIELPFIDAITLIIATLATVFGLVRWWPLQNVLAIAFLTFLLSGVLEHVLGIGSGIYPEKAARAVFDVPWTAPILWLVVLLNARSVTRLVLWPYRERGSYGLWLIFITAVMTALVLVLQDSICDPTAELSKLIGIFFIRLVASGFLLVIVAPFLIPKGAVVPTPDCGPVAIWSVLNLYLIVIAGMEHYWERAGILIVLNGVVTTFSLRARKKRRGPKAPKQPMLEQDRT